MNIRMKGSFIRLLIAMFLLIGILTASLSGCFSDQKKPVNNIDSIKSYLDIPGVTDKEIAALIGSGEKVPVGLEIAVERINRYWTSRVFDYERKLAEAQRLWILGATFLSLITLALILVIFYRSCNERKRLGRLVAEQTSTLKAIFDATPDLIFCKDLNSHFTECNKSMELHFNLRKSDIVGKNDMEAFGMPFDLMEQNTAMDRKVYKTKQPITVEEIIPSFDRKMPLFETIKTPLIQDGEVTGLVVMSRDITQRKAMEEEAKNASIAKSNFIANMNHEMRTPMNVIVGLTDLMMEENNLPENTRESLKKINTAGNTLVGLINDVLDISKVESGKLELMPVKYDVASMLNDIITLNMIYIEDKPITFKLDIDENLFTLLYGDDLRIKQILNNLLSNAFKYTKKGSVTLSVSCRRENIRGKDDVWVSFCISDTGIGIQKENIDKLFIDYNQLDTRVNRAIEGTGLGLSITKKLVELMGGKISVESEYGKGTVFQVRIRQGFIINQRIGKETAHNLRSFSYSDEKINLGKKVTRPDLSYAKVLVVDDFPTNLDVAAGMLRKYKIHVDCVTTGQEAIDLINAGEPLYNSVFMDHMMPGMDGMEATKRIRALDTKYAQNIPIIALTANAISGNEKMFLENGFNAFLPKPFNFMILDLIVERWVRDMNREQGTMSNEGTAR